jgi:hypothetical protein
VARILTARAVIARGPVMDWLERKQKNAELLRRLDDLPLPALGGVLALVSYLAMVQELRELQGCELTSPIAWLHGDGLRVD